MKKKNWLFFLIAALFAQVGTCQELVCMEPVYDQSGIYLKGFAGPNWAKRPLITSSDYDTSLGYVVGGSLGYRFNKLIGLEGEFSYRNNTVNHLKIDELNVDASGDIKQLCGLANVMVHIPLMRCVNPYVGAGAGYRHINSGVNFDESSDRSIDSFIKSSDKWGVYQAIAGVNFVTTDYLNLQLEYRYLTGWSNNECANHSACAAATICF